MSAIRGLAPATRLWFGVFGLWILFLSGAAAQFVGSPGVSQALRLTRLLDTKQAQVTELEKQISQLEGERQLLEKSKVAQEREVRRVLGYAANDEIIFDFSSSD